jgi:hypothetical protein
MSLFVEILILVVYDKLELNCLNNKLLDDNLLCKDKFD